MLSLNAIKRNSYVGFGPQVQPEWAELVSQLQAAIDAVLVEHCVPTGQVIGLYLRGSVAQGHAVAGVSDVDLALYVLTSQHDASAFVAAEVAHDRQDSQHSRKAARASGGHIMPCWQAVRAAMLDAADAVVQRSQHCVKCGACLGVVCDQFSRVHTAIVFRHMSAYARCTVRAAV